MTTGHALRGHVVRIFPESDATFRAAVLAAVDGVSVGGLDDERGVAIVELESTLRRQFYRVHVEEQLPLGATEGELPVIYVFRDGSLVPLGDGPGTPLYVGPLVAPQRNVVRNVIARDRARRLVADSTATIARSRGLRGVAAS